MKAVLLFAQLLLLVSGQSHIGLRVSPDQKHVKQPSRQQFVVTCEGFGAEPNLFTDVRWSDPRGQHVTEVYSKTVNPDLRVERLEGRLLLHFLNPSPDNSGLYRCSATFQHSDSFDAQIDVSFFEDVRWEDCPALQSLVEGVTHERIRCKASANPKPNIQWTKDERPLDPKRYQVDADGVLVNDRIDETDGGVYRVRALVTETGRLHETLVTVQVLRRPQVDDLPPRLEAVEGQEATLTCLARGRPTPLVTWLDPHQRNLSSVGGYSVDRTSGALIISRARKVEDSGRFTCVAENAAGSDRKWTELSVVRAPKVTSWQNRSADESRQSLLECRASGDPLPLLSIRRDGDSRALASGDPRVTLEPLVEREEAVLRMRLNPTSRADDGLYFCRAENRGGVVEATGHLQVRFAPDMRRTPSTSVKHWELHPLNVTCIADAIPNATIRWFFRGLELSDSLRGLTLEDNGSGLSRLHLDVRTAQRDIYGQYRCLALNSLGSAEVRIQVDQAFRPGAVLQTSAERISSVSVSFRVLAPSFDGGMPLKAMHAQFRREDSPEWIARKWPVDARGDHYLLDGLRPRTRYLFRFAAENEVGIGDWSAERAVWTEREGRPERPLFRNLNADAQTREVVSPFGDQFHVAWTLPEDNGRAIRYFELKLIAVRKTEFGFEPVPGAEPRVASVSMSDQSLTAFTFKDLRPDSHYRLELRAYNDLGFSDISDVVFRTSLTKSDDEDDDTDALSSAGPSLALIAGLALGGIVLLLLVTDIFFFFRFRVGAIYFLSRHAFVSSGTSNATRTTSTTKTTTDDRGRRRDDQNEPFFGRASAV